MLKLRRINIERSEEIFSKIERYKHILVQKIRPDVIILFGSLARMDFNEGSDVDLLVVADFEEAFLDRIKRLLELNEEVKLPLKPVGYTLEEFLEMISKGNRFALEIMDKGKILYKSEKISRILNETFGKSFRTKI